MEENSNNPDGSVVDAAVNPAPEGDTNVEDTSLKATLGKVLGKEFPTDEAALASVKETQNFVGKRREDIEAEVKATLKPAVESGENLAEEVRNLKAEVKNSQFYNDHPEYKEHSALIAKFGDNPAEVVASEEFKGIHDQLKAYSELNQSKSVLHSNPRLGKANDKMTEAANLVKEGDHKGASNAAVDAVLDVFEDKA